MRRVVSLVPSLTEVLCLVGGQDYLVGRNHEDDYPEDIRDRPILTSQKTHFTTSAEVDKQVSESLSQGNSLYTINESLLLQLNPDTILTQDLCSVCAIDLKTVERIAKTMHPKPSIVSLNPENLDDVINSLKVVGRAIGKEEFSLLQAKKLTERVYKSMSIAKERAKEVKPKVAFIEWTDPIFIGGHWTPQLIEMAGGIHGLNPTSPISEGERKENSLSFSKAKASFKVEGAALVEYDPDIIIVCPCGLDIPTAKKEAHSMAQKPWWKQLIANRKRKIAIVDGNQMFNRPGPRLVDALEWLVGYLHEDKHLIPHNFPYVDWDGL